jgi:excisionase family DNA binding protein
MSRTFILPSLNGRHPPADPKLPARPPGAPWSLRDAAAWLGISERHLAALCADGRVRSIKIGCRRLIPSDELERVGREGTGT